MSEPTEIDGQPSPQPRWAIRAVQFLEGLDHPGARGLEIGALHRPSVTEPQGSIRFADFTTKEVLLKNYEGMAGYEELVDVDFVVSGVDYLGAVGDERFDYVLASHVGEHIPGFFAWLNGIANILDEGGILSLILPDKRYTFDVLRRPTTSREMLRLMNRRLRRPTALQVFKAKYWSQITVGAIDHGVRRRLVPEFTVMESLRYALKAGLRDEYLDVHCSVFTPASFLDALEGAAKRGILPFSINAFHDTYAPAKEIDFMVRLMRSDPRDTGFILDSIRRARAEITNLTPTYPARRDGRVAIIGET